MRRFSTRRRVRSGIRFAVPGRRLRSGGVHREQHRLSQQAQQLDHAGVDQLQLAEAAAVVDRDLVGAKPDEVEQAVLEVVDELVVAHAAPPALAVHARRVLRPAALPARGRLEVVQDALVAVVDLVTDLAQPQAEVDVLEVVVEAGVETTRPARMRHAGRACTPR